MHILHVTNTSNSYHYVRAPDLHRAVYVSMMIPDALAPNRRQVISNNHVDLIALQCKDHFAHDDVIKWEHFPRYWPFVRGIHRSPVNSPHKGQWRGALMFSLIYIWINGWVNNRKAGALRRYRAHYDVTVMICAQPMKDDVTVTVALIPIYNARFSLWPPSFSSRIRTWEENDGGHVE